MGFEHNWKYKSLENLEKDIWEFNSEEASRLIKECNALRKKPLNAFTTENLRTMILQNIGLNYLIPLALEKLKENILIEGDMYEGDLLYSVLESDINYWKGHKNEWEEIIKLYQKNLAIFEEGNSHRQTRKSFEKFENIFN